MTDEFTPAQRARIDAMLDATYRAFTQNVAAARKIPVEKISDIAKGRVWTGAQAVKVGLVDQLGGYNETLAAIRKKLNLAEHAPLILASYPAPETAIERIEKLLKSFGLDLSMFGATVREWHALRATLAPFMKGLALSHIPVAARL